MTTRSSSIKRYVTSGILALCVAGFAAFVVFFLVYFIACAISPAIFIDRYGEEQPVMPVGQMILAGGLSLLAGLASLIVTFRYLHSKYGK